MFYPRRLTDRPAHEYLSAVADSTGKPLAAGASYRISVPGNVPVKQFWALTVYDRATFVFIYNDLDRTTLSSYDLDRMKLASNT